MVTVTIKGMIVVIVVVAIAVAVATVTVVKTSQLLARGFAARGRGFSSPPGAQRTSQAQQLPLLEDLDTRACLFSATILLSSSAGLTAHCPHGSTYNVAERLLPKWITCSDFLQPSGGWLQWETRRRGRDPIIPGQDLRPGLFRLTCCLYLFYPSHFKMCRKDSQVVWGPLILYFLPSYTFILKGVGRAVRIR